MDYDTFIVDQDKISFFPIENRKKKTLYIFFSQIKENSTGLEEYKGE